MAIKELSVLDLPGGATLEIDDDAGMAWLRGAKPLEYGQRYWDQCLEYHNSPLAEELTRLRYELVSRHTVPGGAHVDVGVGSGRFLEACRRRFAGGLYGVDVNPRAREWLAARGWLREHEALAEPQPCRTSLSLWDVFEHLEAPEKFLAELAPEIDRVFLSLPVFRDFRGLQRHKHFKPGEHLSYWTHDGLVRFFTRHGFWCLESNDFETQAGRESIRSYAFARARDGAPWRQEPPSLLITNGIGDFLAAESFWPEAKRRELTTVYYATRQWRAIRELLEAFARKNYPRLKHHVVLWEDFDESEAFCFTSAGDVTQRVRVPPGVEDFSIARVFPEVTEGLLHHTGSTALRYELADVTHLELPQRFFVIFPQTDDNLPPERNFTSRDWLDALAWIADAGGRAAVILGGPVDESDRFRRPELSPRPGELDVLDLRGHTSILESIEVLKRAEGYLGIDSWLSVPASRLFRWPKLAIKCVRDTGGIQWRHVYWYPRAGFLAPPDKTPWLGRSIAEIAARLDRSAVGA